MKLIDLISLFKSSNSLEAITKNLALSENTEVNLIYMIREIDIDSDIYFFTLEETEDKLTFFRDGCRYIQLFPVPDFIDLINEDFKYLTELKASNIEIATRILEYRNNDA